MKKLLLTALLCFCVSAYAFNWKLVGTNTKEISENLRELLDDPHIYNQMSKAHNPYGDGKACGRILEYLQKLF